MRLSFIVIFFFGFGLSLQAQCDCEPDKKRDKLISQAQDRKNDLKERMAKLQEAVNLDEGCMEPRFQLAKMSFRRSSRSSTLGFSTAEEHFRMIKGACPDYHAELHYYLGLIYNEEGRWSEAKEAFKDFIRFPQNDPAKLNKGHQEQLAEVEALLEEVEFNVELFENPVDFVPVKVNGVSAAGDEYLPTLSPDNETIFYTRKFNKKAKGDLYSRQVEEFTASSRATFEADFDAGKALPAPFNLGDNYGGTSISVNNKEMFVTVCRPDMKGYNNCDIYVSKFSKSISPSSGKEELAWGELMNLGPQVNSALWEAQPSLSADGNTLYFATLREGNKPDASGDPSMDIYFSQRGLDGNWGKARSMGDIINTSGHEKSPFMHGDSRTLYFSSQGRRGAGGYDIYYTRMQDDGTWTNPKNIGIPINTSEDEHGLIVSTDGSEAYYASNKIEGAQGYDIFRFEVPEKAKPEKVVLVRGEVRDEQGEIVRDAKIMLNFVESKRIERVEVDKEDGTYATIINVDTEPVVMTIEKEGHAFQAQLYTIESAKDVIVEKDVEVKKVELGKPYTIDDINYATNSAEIDESSKLVLDQFANYLKAQPKLKIAIHGHTDNVGSNTDNQTLSTERAFEVMNYLQYKEVPASSITFKGFGSSKPISDNSSEEGRAKNRRTEFIITRL